MASLFNDFIFYLYVKYILYMVCVCFILKQEGNMQILLYLIYVFTFVIAFTDILIS